MKRFLLPRIRRSPPLALQITSLLLGALVIAQITTFLLVLLLPPEPPTKYGLRDIAAALSDQNTVSKDLERVISPEPPDLSDRGWLTSGSSRNDLAQMLGVSSEQVRLSFYTPLPFAGVVKGGPIVSVDSSDAEKHETADEDQGNIESVSAFGDGGARLQPAGFVPASLFIIGQHSHGPGGGAPKGMPGGSFPGRGFPGTSQRPTPDFPRDPPSDRQTDPSANSNPFPSDTAAPQSRFPEPPDTTRPSSAMRPSAEAGQTHDMNPQRSSDEHMPDARVPSYAPVIISPLPLPVLPPAPAEPSAIPTGDTAGRNDHSHAQPAEKPTRSSPPVAVPSPAVADPQPDANAAAPTIAPAPRASANAASNRPSRAATVGAIDDARTLLGFSASPYVQGDFIAALQLADGHWAVVQPARALLFSPWQKRVALWFLLSSALVVPLGWAFARRLSRPLAEFADAASHLGRDPSAAIATLDGPAEIGRAAHAFNLMRQRLHSFVDDRTAMVGAISHDLRTPLTRMRFRIEDAPDDLREGLRYEIDAMEEMIASVLAFVRDASMPGSRERLDLRDLLEDVSEDAAVTGVEVPIAAEVAAPVEIDVLGMRRVLSNLVENAVKYGGNARMELAVSGEEAIAAVIDDGPGLPQEEIERVFQPFYRASVARRSKKPGVGLGLAVCRSIARAHGGDVQLSHTARGFRAEVRVPLAYER